MEDLREVRVSIPPGTADVLVKCPACGVGTVHHASNWPCINTEGVFLVSPIATFGTECSACSEPFLFDPLRKNVEKGAL